MAKLFSYDNPVWRLMGRVADVFLLSVLWAVCSLPVITIGASTSALYYVALKMARSHEGYLVRSYLKAFRENLGQATVLWMMLLAVGLFLGADMYWVYGMETGAAGMLFWVLFVLTVVYLFVAVMVFPLEARVQAGTGKIFFLAFMIGMKNFSWVLLMLVTAVCIAALGVLVFWPILFVAVGAIAYIHAFILEWVIFPKYGFSEKKEE
ncbi:DUF624 domain-containing protein [bacterium 0.1xD8-71]|nr:DUF624 domain-containing protein [bacterium 0.1xD8-71]